MTKTIKLKRKSPVDQYPNEALIEDAPVARELPQDNYFEKHEKAIIAKKYLQFTVYMEALNEVLELENTANIESFAFRIRDLVLASQTIK